MFDVENVLDFNVEAMMFSDKKHAANEKWNNFRQRKNFRNQKAS